MMERQHHLHDDRLIECYFAGRTGEPVDPPSAEHLTDCGACAARYTELADFLGDLRVEAETDTDAVFTASRLRHQQEQILRRLEHATRSARVITFPGRSAQQLGGASSRVTPRWLAAAAAAGLFVGVAVGGTILQPGLRRSGARVGPSSPAAMRLAPTPAVRVGVPSTTSESSDDDAFLLELEFALARPYNHELQPFDALTPHVREVGLATR